MFLTSGYFSMRDLFLMSCFVMIQWDSSSIIKKQTMSTSYKECKDEQSTRGLSGQKRDIKNQMSTIPFWSSF